LKSHPIKIVEDALLPRDQQEALCVHFDRVVNLLEGEGKLQDIWKSYYCKRPKLTFCFHSLIHIKKEKKKKPSVNSKSGFLCNMTCTARRQEKK